MGNVLFLDLWSGRYVSVAFDTCSWEGKEREGRKRLDVFDDGGGG